MMTQTETFTMRISPVDRAIFEELARRLKRSQSDSLRTIAREVVQAMEAEERGKTIPQPAEGMTA